MANAREMLEKAIGKGAIVPDVTMEDYLRHFSPDTASAHSWGFPDAPYVSLGHADADFDRRHAGEGWAAFGNDDDLAESRPVIPDLSKIVSVLNLEDDPKDAKNPRTAEEKFFDGFPENLEKWKKKIENDPDLGAWGWAAVREIWRRGTLDKMDSDIAKGRNEELSGIIPTVAGILAPRTMERIGTSGDWKAKDVIADIAENAAMMVPGGVFTGIAGKGLAKAFPRAVGYFTKPGANIAESAIKGTGKMLGNIFGNAVVPFASEGMDTAIYGDDDADMAHRADYSVGDAGIGTAINQGVNRGIMRMAGPIMDRALGGGMGRGGITRVRDFLENLGQPFSKKGDDFARSVMLESSAPIRNAGELLESDLERAARGASVNSAATTEAARQNIAKRHALEAIDNGEIVAIPKSGRGAGKAAEIQEGGDVFLENEIAKKAAENQRYGLEDILDYSGYLKAHPDGSGLSEKTLAATLSANLPEFYNSAIWHGAGAAKKGMADKTLNILNQAIPAWAVNKYGSDPDAGQVLAYFPETKKGLDEERKKTHEAPKKRRASADVLEILSDDSELNDTDRKYLKAIAENPDIVTYGYPSDRDGFNIWLLQRGNRLLRGTAAYRPSFVVE